MDSLITGIGQNISVIIIFLINIIFCIIIIKVGISDNNYYKEVINDIEKLKSIYYIFKGSPIRYKKENEVTELWDDIKAKLNNAKNEDKKKILLQGLLNDKFNPIAEKLKKANSWYEALSTLGLLGTVLGLSIGALYTNDVSKIHIMMSCFQTALFTTLFGLICQLIIKCLNNDVKAENAAEDLQSKIEELSSLSISGHLSLTNMEEYIIIKES